MTFLFKVCQEVSGTDFRGGRARLAILHPEPFHSFGNVMGEITHGRYILKEVLEMIMKKTDSRSKL